MELTSRWQRTTPWLRVWPAAVFVVALHAGLLHGWQVAAPALQRLETLAPSIAVRLLAPPSPAPLPVAAVSLPDPGADPTVGPRAVPSPALRAPQAAGSRAATGASRPPLPPATVPASTVPPAPDYLVSSRLDPGPQLLGDVQPVYPAEAGHTEGSVVLRLLIGKSGSVDEVTVVRSQPKGVFDRSAVAAFSAARFSPGRVLGVPVKSQVTIEVQFTPVDRGGNVSAPTY